VICSSIKELKKTKPIVATVIISNNVLKCLLFGCYFYFTSDYSNRLKSLLELMMEFSPKTASKTWKMAKQLAKSMYMISSGENSFEDSSECQGVEFLVHLGQILAKSVSGRQDVDTTYCELNDLPTIPTKNEILSGKVIHLLLLLK
jgi:hypothetical protein